MLCQLVEEYAQRFRETHGLSIRFTDAAAQRLVSLALEQSKPVRDLCADKFKDFQFGLKLISQNTGQSEFTVDSDAVDAPDKVLSDWVWRAIASKSLIFYFAQREICSFVLASGKTKPCQRNKKSLPATSRAKRTKWVYG